MDFVLMHSMQGMNGMAWCRRYIASHKTRKQPEDASEFRNAYGRKSFRRMQFFVHNNENSTNTAISTPTKIREKKYEEKTEQRNESLSDLHANADLNEGMKEHLTNRAF